MKERTLFAALAVLHLLPFWAVAYVPTTDGPSHVYNAFVQLHLHAPAYPLLGATFEIDPRPLPNWMSQAALVPLLAVLSPAAAEKVLVSAYVVLFLGAARCLAGAADPERRWLSWLAFPFVLNWAFHFGFYNFALSVAFWMLAVGCWWRGRARPGWRLAAVLVPLLVLAYFAHIVSAVLALFALGVLWLAVLPAAVRAGRLRRHLLHVPILLAGAVLPAWFLLAQRGAPVDRSPGGHLLGDLFGLRALFVFAGWDAGPALALVFLGLALLTVQRRLRRTERGLRPVWEEEDAFLLLAGALAAVYFVSPAGMAGGSLLRSRLTLYPWLALLPWLAPPPARALRAGVMAGLALLAGWDVANVTRAYRALDRDVAAMLAAAGPIAPGTRVLPVLFSHQASVPGPCLLTHAIDRVAADKGLVDWRDYEAVSGVFPLRFRPAVRRLVARNGLQLDDILAHAGEIDFLYVWKMPPGLPAARRLEDGFRLVAREGDARLYARRERH
jgi:hypothetical protein